MKVRGCGTRTPGGTYLVCTTSPSGLPVEYFVVDPPISMDTKPFRSPILHEQNGTCHVIIWIGEKFYPSAVDFIEEARIQGVSRRIPNTFPLEKLTANSKMILIHPRATSPNFVQLVENSQLPEHKCKHYNKLTRKPQPIPSHDNYKEFCFWHLYYTLAKTETETKRTIGNTHYHVPFCKEIAEIIDRINYKPAVFATFPIHKIEHIRDRDGKVNPEFIKKTENIKIPVEVVNE